MNTYPVTLSEAELYNLIAILEKTYTIAELLTDTSIDRSLLHKLKDIRDFFKDK